MLIFYCVANSRTLDSSEVLNFECVSLITYINRKRLQRDYYRCLYYGQLYCTLIILEFLEFRNLGFLKLSLADISK